MLVDFCAGGGHVGLLVAHFHPDIQVHLVENKQESLANASQNITSLGLSNVTMYQVCITHHLNHKTARSGVYLIILPRHKKA